MNSWRNAIEQGDLTFIIDFSKMKPGCYHDWKFENGEIVCILCGLINTQEASYVPDPGVTFEFWPRTYLRKQYFDTLFNKIQGREICELPCHMREEFVSGLQEPADWYDIYQHYKNWQLKEWWTCWNYHSENEKRIDMDPQHYKMLAYVDNKWDESKRAKKKINVFYCLYKIVELTGYSTHWVPMKLRSIAITRLDEEWELICKKLNWEFKPTSKKLAKIYWRNFT